MLGDGRPFFLEFVNARTLPLSPHLAVAEAGGGGAGLKGDVGDVEAVNGAEVWKGEG
jgi:hypothetical protein